MGQLDGKIGIITGAASGIGAACARVMSREGARLVLTDLDDAAGQRVAEATGSIYLHHDVTDEAGWPNVVSTVEKRFGGLHVLVANAGIGIMGSGDRNVAGRLAAPDGGECRWCFPVGQVLRSRDAPIRRRLHRHAILGCRAARFRRAGGLQCDQGCSAIVRQIDGA